MQSGPGVSRAAGGRAALNKGESEPFVGREGGTPGRENFRLVGRVRWSAFPIVRACIAGILPLWALRA